MVEAALQRVEGVSLTPVLLKLAESIQQATCSQHNLRLSLKDVLSIPYSHLMQPPVAKLFSK